MKKETDKFTVELVDDRYFVMHIMDDADIEIEDIRSLVEFQKEIGGGNRYPVVIIPSSTAFTDNELLKYISDDRNLPYTTADAFVLNSVAHRILANLYKRLNPSKRPTKFFKSEAEALEWIGQFG